MIFTPPKSLHRESKSGLILARQRDTPIVLNLKGGGRTVEQHATAKITWLLSSTTKVEAYHGGEWFKDMGTFTDFYGHLESVRGAIESIESQCAKFSISKESTLELRATTTVAARPYFENDEDLLDNTASIDKNHKMKVVDATGNDLFVPLARAYKDEWGEHTSRRLQGLTLAESTTFSTKSMMMEDFFIKSWGLLAMRDYKSNEGKRTANEETVKKFDAAIAAYQNYLPENAELL
tara:strand:+ start:9661 stop:10368 length:708 start_codon:yes stop_codon:yes gene_type:complete